MDQPAPVPRGQTLAVRGKGQGKDRLLVAPQHPDRLCLRVQQVDGPVLAGRGQGAAVRRKGQVIHRGPEIPHPQGGAAVHSPPQGAGRGRIPLLQGPPELGPGLQQPPRGKGCPGALALGLGRAVPGPLPLLFGLAALDLGLLLLAVEDHRHRCQQDNGQDHQHPPALPAALLLERARLQKTDHQVRRRGGAALQVAPGLGQGVPLPQLLLAAPPLPQLGRLGHLLEEDQLLPAVLDPAPQLLPGMDQGLVGQLQLYLLAPLAVGAPHGQQPGVGQPPQHLLGLGLQSLEQLLGGEHPAGALGGDQPQQQQPGLEHLGRGQALQHALCVPGQGPAHPAQGVVDRPQELLALPVPLLPQLAGNELQQGQGGRLPLHRGDHLLAEPQIIVGVAQHLHRAQQDLLQGLGLRAADDGDVAHGLPHPGPLGEPAEEVLPQGEDHPHRILGIVCRGAQRLHEALAGLRVRHQGVEFFQLVHEEQHPLPLFRGQAMQQQAELGGVLVELPRQPPHLILVGFARVRDFIRLALPPGGYGLPIQEVGVHRDGGGGVGGAGQQPPGQGAKRIAARAELDHLPPGLLPEPRHHPGHHKGALARARGTHHRQHGLLPHPLQEGQDLLVPAKEEVRVLLAKGAQAAERALLGGEAVVVLQHHGLQGRGRLLGREPLLGVLEQAAVDEGDHLGRQLLVLRPRQGSHRGQRRRRHRLGGQLHQGGLLQGALPHHQLAEEHPQGPHVSLAGDVLVQPLLRRHVGGRPPHPPLLLVQQHLGGVEVILGGDLFPGPVLLPADDVGQAEIQHPDAAVPGDLDIFRLEVPVQDAVLVGLFQGLGNGPGHALGLLQPRRRLLDALAQGLALQVLQGHVGGALVLPSSVDGDDVGVVEAGRGPGLEDEPVHGLLGADAVRVDHLEGHLAPQLGVPGQVDLPHAAAAQEPHHLEVVHHLARIEYLRLVAGG